MFYRGLNEEIDIYNNHVYLYFLFCFVNVLVCEIWGSRFWMTLHFFHLLPQLSNQETPVNEWVKRSGSGIIFWFVPLLKTCQGFFFFIVSWTRHVTNTLSKSTSYAASLHMSAWNVLFCTFEDFIAFSSRAPVFMQPKIYPSSTTPSPLDLKEKVSVMFTVNKRL